MSLEVEEKVVSVRRSQSASEDSRQRPESPEWFLVNSQSGAALSLNREMIFIGRSKCDVTLESVENRHAVICFNPKDSSVYVRDLNTVHGSFVNENRLPSPSYVKLKPNDSLRFGLSPQIFVVSDKAHIPEIQSAIAADVMPISAANNDVLQTEDQEEQQPAPELSMPSTSSCEPEPGSVDKSVKELARILKQNRTTDCSAATQATQRSAECDMSLSSPQIFMSTSDPKSNGLRRVALNHKSYPHENGLSNHKKTDPLQPSTEEGSFIFTPQQQQVEKTNDTSVSSVPKPHPAAFTISFDDDVVGEEKKKSFAIGDSIRKFAPKKTFERAQQRRHSKPPSTHSNQSPIENYEPRSLPIMSETAGEGGQSAQLSDSAVFLIQRMFDCDQANSKLSPEEDSKSEAGTYTLETDNIDLERARQMIDDVFGVENQKPPHVPHSPGSTRSNSGQRVPVRSALPKDIQRPNIGSLNDECRSRTFTRSKPHRGSLEDQDMLLGHKNRVDSSCEQQSYNMRSKDAGLQRKPIPNPKIERERRDSFSSSKSGLSSKTIEVKNAAIINQVRPNRAVTESPQCRRREFDIASDSRKHYSESVSSDSGSGGKYVTENVASGTSGLKLNRAFALRRARLGMETPGVPLNLTDEKQKRNQDNRNKSTARRSESSLSRQDGGRYSLRVAKSKGKPPLPNSYPSSPEKKANDVRKHMPIANPRTFRSGSETNPNQLSPASSSSSIPNQYVQRSSSFGPQAGRGMHLRAESSDRIVRAMTPLHLTRRILSSRPHSQQQQHQQQQYADNGRNKQQANVAPIKRVPDSAPSAMTTSLNDQLSDQHSALANQPVIQRRTLSSLDNLVVSAILQLSAKLRFGMREWLDQEKVKHLPGSETRLMIDEILPQVSNIGSCPSEGLVSSGESLSKDLSTILKNLKKVEQSLEVISLLTALEPANLSNRVTYSMAKDSKSSNNS